MPSVFGDRCFRRQAPSAADMNRLPCRVPAAICTAAPSHPVIRALSGGRLFLGAPNRGKPRQEPHQNNDVVADAAEGEIDPRNADSKAAQ
jgi:hypothetical protein